MPLTYRILMTSTLLKTIQCTVTMLLIKSDFEHLTRDTVLSCVEVMKTTDSTVHTGLLGDLVDTSRNQRFNYTKIFFLQIISFKHGDGAKLWGYVQQLLVGIYNSGNFAHTSLNFRQIPNYKFIIFDSLFMQIDVKKSCPATRHEGAWGRGGIAPTHS
jgi:hypothetical protein